MTKTQEQLLSILARALFGAPTAAAVTPAVLVEAKEQSVTTLIAQDYSMLASNIRVFAAHAELTKILAGIPFTTFKGCASAFYYPDPISRPMGDVDFIVRERDYECAKKRLTEAGYTRTGKEHERHEAFRKNDVIVELHSEIKGVPNGADGIATDSAAAEERVRALLSDLIDSAVTAETQQGPVIVPDALHHGLIMLLHVAGHMLNDGGVGLRHLCDWAVYVERTDLSRYRAQLESMGLWVFACQLTAVSTRYLSLPKQFWAGEWDAAFLERLIEEILSAGNFGQREAGRAALASMKKVGFADKTRKRYPAARIPVLLPFFMLLYILRFCCLVIMGKRRRVKLSTLAGTREREALFRQFKLFETSSER